MPWFWTDHLAGLLASTHGKVPANWVQNPIAIRVDIDANPLLVASDMLSEDSDDEPPSLNTQKSFAYSERRAA